ncbi:MAG: hypothetical protein KF778_14550 [Rhodocyclaceae bacterium]|nr:hypothetical protein [Rhodocyclaceae bacterium]MBX3669617.1 hypothetical protein [Rhodocyclaceae bacterium]
MKLLKIAGFLLAALCVATPAWSHGGRHHGHGHFGTSIVIGGYFGWPWYYGPAYYPAPVVVQPQMYVEPNMPPPRTWWYYCEDPAGYYPYVPACNRAWRQVEPQ